MAFSEIETKRIEKEMEEFLTAQRPPEQLRNQVDLGYRIDNQSVVIFEIRPQWDDKSKKIEPPIAKTTFLKSRNEWHVYWFRSDMKWHRYEPHPTVKKLKDFLRVVIEDEYCCFWG